MTRIHVLIILLFNTVNFCLADLSPKEIMRKNEEARRLKEVVSSVILTTGGTTAQTRIKKFTWWRKLKPNQVHFNTLTRFHEPAEVKNEAILFLENSGDENEVLLYLPTYKKIRRVERNNQSSSFMGSEFSYADIATPHVDDFDFKLLRTEACPMNKAIKCWVIESVPVQEKTKNRTGYSKSHQWVRQDNFMIEQAEHYDRENQLWKKLNATKIQLVEKTEKKWMSLFVKIENLKNKKFTTLEFSNVKVNSGIPDSLFAPQNLGKIN